MGSGCSAGGGGGTPSGGGRLTPLRMEGGVATGNDKV